MDHIAIDIFRDTAGGSGAFILSDNGKGTFIVGDVDGLIDEVYPYPNDEFLDSTNIVTADARKFRLHGSFPRKDVIVYDIPTLTGHQNVFQSAKAILGEDRARELADSEARVEASIRTAQAARIDLDEQKLIDLVPLGFIRRMVELRTMCANAAFEKILSDSPGVIERYAEETWPSLSALINVESRGVHIDRGFCEHSLKEERWSDHERSFFRSCLALSKRDGRVYFRMNLVGTKTGRMSVESGFNVHGIPRGEARRAIVPRPRKHRGSWLPIDGKDKPSVWVEDYPEKCRIVSLDYNAIDYRSIIAADFPGMEELRKHFSGRDDFHSATMELLFGNPDPEPDVRNAMKQVTYSALYGASLETVARTSGISVETASKIMRKFDERMGSVLDFKRDLHRRSIESGYVETPHGTRVPVEPDFTPGKVLGLYAQTFSSWIFRKGLEQSGVPMMLVHDEMVFDVSRLQPRGELYGTSSSLECMERDALVSFNGMEFRAKAQEGRDYFEATT